MVDYMDLDFRLRHNDYQIVMGSRWQVVAPSVKIRDSSQALASVLYRVFEGSTRVSVIGALWNFRCFYDLCIIFLNIILLIFLKKIVLLNI